jgi:hypothetical protein
MDYKTINEGDIIRLKNGRIVTIEDINPNPDWEADEETWAEGSDRHGYNNVEVYPQDVETAELVMTAAEAAGRTLPKVKDLVRELELGSFSKFQHIETEYGSDEGGEAYFTVETNDGLTVQFTVTVSNVHLTDF